MPGFLKMKKYYPVFFTFSLSITLLFLYPVSSGSACPTHKYIAGAIMAKGVAGCEWSDIIPPLAGNDTDSIYVPNVFTPNGDGINDVLTIYAKGITSFSIEIFDRWGQLVFISNYTTISWDGRTNGGVKVSDGVYYYVIKATSESGKDMSRKGTVTVIGSRANGNGN